MIYQPFSIIVFFCVVCASFMFFFDVLFPFLSGAVLAYLLSPLVSFLEKIKGLQRRRALIICGVFFVLICFFVYGTFVLFYSIQYGLAIQMLDDIAEYRDSVEYMFVSMFEALKSFDLKMDARVFVSPLMKEVQDFLQQFVFSLKGLVSTVLDSAVLLVIAPLTAFYILKDKDLFLPSCKKYMRLEHFVIFSRVLQLIHEKIGGYFKALSFSSFIVGFLIGVFLVCFQEFSAYALLLGVIAGITNIIPYFGSFIGGVPIVIIAVMKLSYAQVVVVILYLVFVHGVVGFVIYPKLTSKSVDIHPLLVLIAIFLGNHVFGVLGMLIAVPLVICVKELIKLIFRYYYIDNGFLNNT